MEKQLELLTVEGFNRKYEEYLPKAASENAAYQAAEVDFIEHFKHRRYRNFKSFQNSRNQWLRIRKKNREQQAA